MEADLQRFYRVDLGDLWRGSLSVRRLYVLLSNLPPGSAVWSLENKIPQGYALSDFLLMDVYAALTGEPHPARPGISPASSSASSGGGEARSLVERLREQRARLDAKRKESGSG